MSAVAAQLLVALVVAIAAGAARVRVGEPEGLALLGLALGLAVPWPHALAVVLVALAVAAKAYVERARRERDRATVGKYLAQIEPSVSLERPPFPAVEDDVARRALATQEQREIEFALRMAPPLTSKPRPAPGVRARFMAAMGHELRSPLNSITGFAQLLEDGSDGPLNDAQRENVVLVRRAAEELLTLLTDILDAARIESGRVRLDRQWIAPVEVLTQALDRMRDTTECEGTTVEAQLQPGLGPLFVDRSRLGQALFNVLRAVARTKGGLVAKVREVSEGGRSVVRFEVFDRSRPISESDAARAFDPDPAARPEGRSLALGLALSVARDLAQLHGGDARAEPLDGGTNWVVWVPAATKEEAGSRRGRSPSPPRGSAIRARR